MTKAKIKECIELLSKDGINSKEKVKQILQAELDKIEQQDHTSLDEEYIEDVLEIEGVGIC